MLGKNLQIFSCANVLCLQMRGMFTSRKKGKEKLETNFNFTGVQASGTRFSKGRSLE